MITCFGSFRIYKINFVKVEIDCHFFMFIKIDGLRFIEKSFPFMLLLFFLCTLITWEFKNIYDHIVNFSYQYNY